MLRTIQSCEKNVVVLPAAVFNLVAATSTVVLADVTGTADEFAARTIQNTGNTYVYYAFGQTCNDTVNYHGRLGPGEQVDCFGCTSVVCYSTDPGNVVSTTVFKRIGL